MKRVVWPLSNGRFQSHWVNTMEKESLARGDTNVSLRNERVEILLLNEIGVLEKFKTASEWSRFF